MRLNPSVFNKWIYDTIDDYTNRIEVYMGGAGSGKGLADSDWFVVHDEKKEDDRSDPP